MPAPRAAAETPSDKARALQGSCIMAQVIILCEQDFQDAEVIYPYYRMKEAGHTVKLAGAGEKQYKGKYGYVLAMDGDIGRFKPDSFDAVIIPGGWAPDYLRRNSKMVDFVKKMNEKGRIVASICHGSSLLVSAGMLAGRTMTCFEAVKDDAIAAGAHYVDRDVVVDRNLITSRKPDDLPAFCRELLKALEK